MTKRVQSVTEAVYDGLAAMDVLLRAEEESPEFTSWTTADELEAARAALEVLKRHFR